MSLHPQSQSIISTTELLALVWRAEYLSLAFWPGPTPSPHPVAPSELWWQHPYPCHRSDTVRPASINIWGGQIFRGWIIYSAWLETLSGVEDLVACMFVLDLYNKTWPSLIRKSGARELVGCVFECVIVCVCVCKTLRKSERKDNWRKGFAQNSIVRYSRYKI